MTDQDHGEPLPAQPEPAVLPAEPAPMPQALQFDGWITPKRVQRPLVGATLWCFGALFWSYLVVGELVVWTSVPEVLGVLAVLGAFGLAWYRATSQMAQAPRWRWLLPGIVAFFSWLLALAMSTAVFSTGGRKEAELAALLLWSFSATTYTLGRHLAAQHQTPLSPNARNGRIALWLITGIATLMAGVNIISYA